jgi:hypothetical protein
MCMTNTVCHIIAIAMRKKEENVFDRVSEIFG